VEYRYRYRNLDNTPLVKCPSCKGDLTRHGGVVVETVMNCTPSEFKTRIIPETGDLIDSDDGQVAKGFHSQTCCGNPKCSEELTEWEVAVHELEDDGNDEDAGYGEDGDDGEGEEPDAPGRAKLVINNAVGLRHKLIEKYGPKGEEIYDLILEHGEPIFGVVPIDAE
jgi:hypothetical protein